MKVSDIDRAGSTQVRRAKPKDIPTMVQLLQQLFTIEQDFNFNAEKHSVGLSLLIADKHHAAWVAEQAGRVVGMCTMQRVVSSALGGWSGLVEDVVVDRSFRGLGIGTMLIKTVEHYAWLWGYCRIQLLADHSNTQALRFYQRHGWESTSLQAWRKFRPAAQKEN